MIKILQQLIQKLKELVGLYKKQIETIEKTPEEKLEKDLKEILPDRDHLYDVALTFLGKDVTPEDVVEDEYACVEVIDTIYYSAFGYFMDGGVTPEISTYRVYKVLENNPHFKKVLKPKNGTIILSPTGYTTKKSYVKNGHIGIYDSKNEMIMSNNSSNGRFEKTYTIETWKKRWVDDGGYLMLYYDVV